MTTRLKIFLVVSTFALVVICILGLKQQRTRKAPLAKAVAAHELEAPEVVESEPPIASATPLPATSLDIAPAKPVVPESETARPLLPVLADTADESELLLQQFDSRLTDTPALEDFIRDRLWLTLDQLNNPVIKGLGLTSAELDQFRTLLVSNLVTAANYASAFTDNTQIEHELENQLAAQRANLDLQLRQLLGETRFAAYAAYRQDYGQFNRIKFLKPDEPLSDNQTEQVVLAMANERQVVNSAVAKLRSEDSDAGQLLSPEERESQDLEIQQLLNERIYSRLESILSPDRLATFAEFQRLQ